MASSNILGLLYLKDFKPKELAFLCNKTELAEVARDLDIKNRSTMKKMDLAMAINERLNNLV